MSTVRDQINVLVRVGIEHYPHTMRSALQVMVNCETREQIDNAIDRLPETCRAKARHVMRNADAQGLTMLNLRYYLSTALDANEPDSATLMQDIQELGYEQAAEKHGIAFVYMT